MNNDVTTASPEQIERMREMLDSFKAFLLNYEFGIDEILTKINVLRSEYETIKDSSPIEHVSSRLKTPESIIGKMQRKGGPITLAGIRETVRDIAGVRVVCAFIEDTYRVAEAFTRQPDITVVEVKDYIKNPKPNGYKSLHLIVEVPVFLSTGPVSVPVEVQIRTIAMDFWASLEHKIYYKFNTEIPTSLREGLREAAQTASRLDVQMEQIHTDVLELRPAPPPRAPISDDVEFFDPERLKNLLTGN